MLIPPEAWAVVALAGVGIGATSIGGLFVVPALTVLAGLPLLTALAASSLAFVLVGVQVLLSRRQGLGGDVAQLAPLLGTALVAALAGVALAPFVPAGALRAWIGVLAVLSGLAALGLRPRGTGSTGSELSLRRQVVLGGVVGLGSALSGTGGPVMLLPLLLLGGHAPGPAVQAGQLVQMPIALAACAAHAVAGRLEPALGLGVGAVLVVGAVAGQALARRLPTRGLQRLLAAVLIATGVWFALGR